MNSSEIPCILWLPVLYPVESVGEFSGSNGYALALGFTALIARPIPMTVPPVPTPATTASGVLPIPFKASMISAPVYSTWVSILSGLENWPGRNAPPLSAISSHILIEPKNPPSSLDTSLTSAP